MASLLADDATQVTERMALSALRGDTAAKETLSKGEKQKVLRRLQLIALQRSMDRPTADAALEMIKSTPGYCDHFRDQIVNDKTGGDDLAIFQAFKILGTLKTEESIATVAEFLFDPSNPTAKGTADTSDPSPNRILAMLVLSEAKIEGAPTGKVNADTLDVRLLEWREWWKKKKSPKSK